MENIHINMNEVKLTSNQFEKGHDNLIGEAFKTICEKPMHLRVEIAQTPTVIDFKNCPDIYGTQISMEVHRPGPPASGKDCGPVAPHEHPSAAPHARPPATPHERPQETKDEEAKVAQLGGIKGAETMALWKEQRGESFSKAEFHNVYSESGQAEVAKMQKQEALAGDWATKITEETAHLQGRNASPSELAAARQIAELQEAQRYRQFEQDKINTESKFEDDSARTAVGQWQKKNPGHNLSPEERAHLESGAKFQARAEMGEARVAAGIKAEKEEDTIARVLHDKKDPLAISHRRQEAELAAEQGMLKTYERKH